jgi:hypothetical protein
MGRMPLALENRPVLQDHLALTWKVYHVLSRSRHWGERGPQPITCAEFFAYCDGVGIQKGKFREDLLDLVQAMDQAYLEDYVERHKDGAAAEGDKPPKSDDIPPALGAG